MTDSNVIDLAPVLAAGRERALKNAEIITLDFGEGNTFRLTTAYNAAVMMDMLNPNATGGEAMQFALACVVEDDRKAFHDFLRSLNGLDGELFGEILNQIVTAVTGRPTVPPTGSSRTSRSPKSGSKSKGTSSGAPVVELDLPT